MRQRWARKDCQMENRQMRVMRVTAGNVSYQRENMSKDKNIYRAGRLPAITRITRNLMTFTRGKTAMSNSNIYTGDDLMAMREELRHCADSPHFSEEFRTACRNLVPGPGVPGEYDSEACIRWQVEREVRKVQGPEAPKDRLARLQGDELEMKLERERGKLIDAAAVEPVMRAAIVSARERIRNEPARLAIALEGKTKAEREALLRELFNEVLGKLSSWQQADAEDNDDDTHEHTA